MALIKKWCLRAESNHRHGDFQSPALPTELQRRFYSACLVYYILSEMSTTFFKNFCIFCKQEKTVTEAQPATVSLFSAVLRRICPHNKVRRSILFMREQPHGAAQNSSSETRLLYICLVIYTVCRPPCRFKCRIAFSANLIIRRYGSRQTDL